MTMQIQSKTSPKDTTVILPSAAGIEITPATLSKRDSEREQAKQGN